VATIVYVMWLFVSDEINTCTVKTLVYVSVDLQMS